MSTWLLHPHFRAHITISIKDHYFSGYVLVSFPVSNSHENICPEMSERDTSTKICSM